MIRLHITHTFYKLLDEGLNPYEAYNRTTMLHSLSDEENMYMFDLAGRVALDKSNYSEQGDLIYN